MPCAASQASTLMSGSSQLWWCTLQFPFSARVLCTSFSHSLECSTHLETLRLGVGGVIIPYHSTGSLSLEQQAYLPAMSQDSLKEAYVFEGTFYGKYFQTV